MASTHSTMYMTKDSTKDLEGTTMIPSLSVDFLEFGNDSGMPQMATVLPSPKATRAVEATPLVEVYSEDKSAAGGGAESDICDKCGKEPDGDAEYNYHYCGEDKECDVCAKVATHRMPASAGTPDWEKDYVYYYCDEHYELGGECEDCGVMMNENWDIATRKCAVLCRGCGKHHDEKGCEVCDEDSDEEDSDEEGEEDSDEEDKEDNTGKLTLVARSLVEDKSAGGAVEATVKPSPSPTRAKAETPEAFVSGGACVLCPGAYTGMGHNARPLSYGRCCDDCNTKVINERERCVRFPVGTPEVLTASLDDGVQRMIDGKDAGHPSVQIATTDAQVSEVLTLWRLEPKPIQFKIYEGVKDKISKPTKTFTDTMFARDRTVWTGFCANIVDFYILRAILHKKPIPIIAGAGSAGGMTVIGTYKPRNPKTTLDEERKAAAAVAKLEEERKAAAAAAVAKFEADKRREEAMAKERAKAAAVSGKNAVPKGLTGAAAERAGQLYVPPPAMGGKAVTKQVSKGNKQKEAFAASKAAKDAAKAAEKPKTKTAAEPKKAKSCVVTATGIQWEY